MTLVDGASSQPIPRRYYNLVPQIRTAKNGPLLPFDVVCVIGEFLGCKRLKVHLICPHYGPRTIFWWGYERMTILFDRLGVINFFSFNGARLYINGVWIHREQTHVKQMSVWDYGLRDGQTIHLRFLAPPEGGAFQHVQLRGKPTVRRSIRISRKFEQRTGRVSVDTRYKGVYR